MSLSDNEKEIYELKILSLQHNMQIMEQEQHKLEFKLNQALAIKDRQQNLLRAYRKMVINTLTTHQRCSMSFLQINFKLKYNEANLIAQDLIKLGLIIRTDRGGLQLNIAAE